MRTRDLSLASLLILSAFQVAVLGGPPQGGWVSTINPGFVQQPAVSVVRPSIRIVQPSGGTHIPHRSVVVLPPPVPAAHLGTPELRAPEGGEQRSITPNPEVPQTHPAYNHSPRTLTPYLYTSHFVAGTVRSETRGTQIESTDLGVYIDMPRADVIRLLGRPSATVYRSSGQETLIFSTVTIIIQNGVVAFIQ